MKYLNYFTESKKFIVSCYLDSFLNQYDESDELRDMTVDNFSINSLNKIKEDLQWFLETSFKYDDDPFEGKNSCWIGERIYFSRTGLIGFDCSLADQECAKFLDFLCDSLGEDEYYVKDKKIHFYKYESQKRPNIEKYIKDRRFKKDINKYNL